MNPNPRDDSIASSRLLKCGTLNKVRLTATGESLHLSRVRVTRLRPQCRIYYMYANMASLNAWRRSRGFSELNLLYVHWQTLTCCRHFCPPSSLW